MKTLKTGFFTIIVIIVTVTLFFLSGIFSTNPSTFQINKNIQEFNLKTHTGNNFNYKLYKGFPSVFFFGFTSCPDICPTTLAEISKMIINLGKKSKMIKFYFVSVDPDTDTIENINYYLESFNDQIIGITGEKANVEKFLKYMNVFHKKVDLGDDMYTFDHSSQMFLFKKNGDFFATISPTEDTKIAMNKLNAILE